MRFILPFFLFVLVSHVPAQTNAVDAATNAPAAAAPSANQALIQDAVELAKAKNYDAAIAKLDTAVQNGPPAFNVFMFRGQLYSEKKVWDKAASDFQSAHLIDPKNTAAIFNLAETSFVRKQYDAARPGFEEAAHERNTALGELATYKVFLCDLLGNHPDAAKTEFDQFNQVGSGASYYYANAAWNLVNHQPDKARDWIISAAHIYDAGKNGLYARSLIDLGYLPLPPAKA